MAQGKANTAEQMDRAAAVRAKGAGWDEVARKSGVDPKIIRQWRMKQTEEWGVEELRRRKAEIGEAGYARGYRLVCVNEEDSLIQRDWIKFHTETNPTFERTVLAIDPAVSVHSKADGSALVFAGRLNGAVLVMQAVARRVSAPHLIEWIEQWNTQYEPDMIVMESNAAFAGLRDVMQRHTSFGHKLTGRAATKHKADRIAALSVSVQNGTVLFHRNQTELIDELLTFPNAAHDDLADACAAAVEWLLNTREPRAWV
jgi:predicted phage terminase large subunit-like protein